MNCTQTSKHKSIHANYICNKTSQTINEPVYNALHMNIALGWFWYFQDTPYLILEIKNQKMPPTPLATVLPLKIRIFICPIQPLRSGPPEATCRLRRLPVGGPPQANFLCVWGYKYLNLTIFLWENVQKNQQEKPENVLWKAKERRPKENERKEGKSKESQTCSQKKTWSD